MTGIKPDCVNPLNMQSMLLINTTSQSILKSDSNQKSLPMFAIWSTLFRGLRRVDITTIKHNVDYNQS